MAEIKRFGPVPIRGEFDEDGMYHRYERPHYNLFVEAVGSDGEVHTFQVRSGSDLMDHPGLEGHTWRLLEQYLVRQMKKDGVWVD